jgi:hypothetical protein
MTDQLSPFGWRTVHKVLHSISQLAQCARTVQVRIDTYQLVVIVAVRVLIGRRVVRVIHART